MPFKYHILLPLLSILIITLAYIFEDKRTLVYPNTKYKKLFRKKKKSTKRRKTLLIIPKLILFLFIVSEDLQNQNNSFKISNKERFTLDYISLSNIIKSDFMTQQYQLYALSKLRYKNHNTFCRYLLLLSGDVELNVTG